MDQKRKRVRNTGKKAIILVSKDRADDKENISVVFILGFLRKLKPVYIFIIVSDKKYISWEL